LSLQSNIFFIGNLNPTDMKANVKTLEYAITYLTEREMNPVYVWKNIYRW